MGHNPALSHAGKLRRLSGCCSDVQAARCWCDLVGLVMVAVWLACCDTGLPCRRRGRVRGGRLFCRDHSQGAIAVGDIWRKSHGQNGQNDPENAGLAHKVPRSVRMVRQLPGTGPPRRPGAVPPAAPLTRAPPAPGRAGSERAGRPAEFLALGIERGCGLQPQQRTPLTRKVFGVMGCAAVIERSPGRGVPGDGVCQVTAPASYLGQHLGGEQL